MLHALQQLGAQSSRRWQTGKYQFAIDGDGRCREDAEVNGMVDIIDNIDLMPAHATVTDPGDDLTQLSLGAPTLAATG